MRMGVVLAAVLAVAVAGCGGESVAGAGDDHVLRYFPDDAVQVALLPADPEDRQLNRLFVLLRPSFDDVEASSLEELVRQIADDEVDVDYERDVQPLLGGTLAYGVLEVDAEEEEADLLVALATDGAGDQLGRLLEDLGGATSAGEHRGVRLYAEAGGDPPMAALDGDVLVLAFSADTRAALRAAIDRSRDGPHLRADDFAERLGDDAQDAAVRVTGSLAGARELPQLRGAADLPWIRALRSYGIALDLDDDELRGSLRVTTDPAGLSDDDLPLAPGEESPPVARVEDALTSANRDQSATTVFLSRFARAAHPESRFVREVEATERALRIDFDEEVLAQFDGPSTSMLRPDGSFAAVSTVADPDRMRDLLPRLAPRLPDILAGLERLGRSGLIPLLLFAPDAPLTPNAAMLLAQGIRVDPVGETEPDERLFEVRGLDEELQGPLRETSEVVFGMLGDRFVVGSDAESARAIARAPSESVDDANGTGVAIANLRRTGQEFARALLELETVELGDLVGELQASTEAIEGRARVSVPGGLDP